MTRGSWGASKRSLGQVDHISHDWLTPCEYLPYIDALLRNIDLDPCSTYDANNQFLRAEKIYTYDDCLLYTSPSPRDKRQSRMPSSA